jgi:hypothetical protein
VGEERDRVRTGDDPEKVRTGDEVEAHQLQSDEREAIREGDDEVEGHALVSDQVRAEQLRDQVRAE